MKFVFFILVIFAATRIQAIFYNENTEIDKVQIQRFIECLGDKIFNYNINFCEGLKVSITLIEKRLVDQSGLDLKLYNCTNVLSPDVITEILTKISEDSDEDLSGYDSDISAHGPFGYYSTGWYQKNFKDLSKNYRDS